MDNVYLKFKDEIKRYGEERKVDWSVATAMWEVDHQDFIPQNSAERMRQKKEFFKEVDGIAK
jgi:hypothetical protein